ncbi:hypothetical protein GOV10_06515 [Candidatus Woesearchaeota archaeon]|nr:hypothetical protein [Candidatus Woesearchaeota archaeon]
MVYRIKRKTKDWEYYRGLAEKALTTIEKELRLIEMFKYHPIKDQRTVGRHLTLAEFEVGELVASLKQFDSEKTSYRQVIDGPLIEKEWTHQGRVAATHLRSKFKERTLYSLETAIAEQGAVICLTDRIKLFCEGYLSDLSEEDGPKILEYQLDFDIVGD